MVPFSKEQNRRIYITALVISFLLIVGSIYLHLRQKTHLGRISFHFDSDRMQPTSGIIENSTWSSDNDYESKTLKYNEESDSTTIQPDSESDESENPSSEEITSDGYKTVYSVEENSSSNSNSNSSEEILVEDMVSKMLENYDTKCLHCLCMTLNECKPTICGSVSCGKFMISQFYWSDADKPIVQDGSSYLSESIEHYKCANDDKCSQRAVRQYFQRYRRDCNKDGIIDCRDQIALHLLGPSGCLRLNVSQKHEARMNSCLAKENLV